MTASARSTEIISWPRFAGQASGLLSIPDLSARCQGGKGSGSYSRRTYSGKTRLIHGQLAGTLLSATRPTACTLNSGRRVPYIPFNRLQQMRTGDGSALQRLSEVRFSRVGPLTALDAAFAHLTIWSWAEPGDLFHKRKTCGIIE